MLVIRQFSKIVRCGIVSLFLMLPISIYAQSQIRLDTEIEGHRTIATEASDFATNETFTFNMSIMATQIDSYKEYFLNLSLPSYKKKLYVKKGQRVLLKQSNGQIITLKTSDDIYQHPGFEIRYDRYTNEIGIGVSRQVLQNIIKGKIIKIRIATDDAIMVDADITDNRLSTLLQSQLKSLDDAFAGNRVYEGF